jgi:hypothetical protein
VPDKSAQELATKLGKAYAESAARVPGPPTTGNRPTSYVSTPVVTRPVPHGQMTRPTNKP